jgi:hypothetical protein
VNAVQNGGTAEAAGGRQCIVTGLTLSTELRETMVCPYYSQDRIARQQRDLRDEKNAGREHPLATDRSINRAGPIAVNFYLWDEKQGLNDE